MKNNFYTIGIGGFGVRLAEETSRKMANDGASVIQLAIDTDSYEVRQSNCNHIVDVSCQESLGKVLSALEEKEIRIFSEEDVSQLKHTLFELSKRSADF